MAIIAQRRLFGWREIEKLGDLERLKLVLESISDEELAVLLEKKTVPKDERVSGTCHVGFFPRRRNFLASKH